MADYEDTNVKDLIINNMSQEKFNELKDAGDLDPTQIYLTPTEESGGASLPDQTDNAGKFLQTNGTEASWQSAITNLYPYYASSLFITYDNQSLNSGQAYIGSSVVILSGNQQHWNIKGSGNSVVISGGYVDHSTQYGVTIGESAKNNAYEGGIAIGYSASTASSDSVGNIFTNNQIAIGRNAQTKARYAIQLGSGTNSDVNTFKVGNANGNFEIMSADGTMPTDRYTITPTVAGTYVPKLTIAEDGTATREWGTESGGAGGDYLPLSGGTMTGSLSFSALSKTYELQPTSYGNFRFLIDGVLTLDIEEGTGLLPARSNYFSLGRAARIWKNVYTAKLSNGADLIVPTAGGTLARIEDINNIVEVLPTADNGYTTVKNFGNGYVEITGYASIGTVGAGTGSEVQIDLPAGYTMADANYWVNIAPTSETTMFDFKAEAKARSTTHFMVAYKNEDTVTGLTAAGVYWEVHGMLATTEA